VPISLAVPRITTCWHCGKEFTAKRRTARFCTDAHYRRALRREAAGVAIDAFSGPHGAQRGRLKLGERTTLDVALEHAYRAGVRDTRKRMRAAIDASDLKELAAEIRGTTAALKAGPR
jgi:hypothetical protein